MNWRSDAEINEAIQQCSNQCQAAADPRTCVEGFAIALIASGWEAHDAREVLTESLHRLAKLTGDESLYCERT